MLKIIIASVLAVIILTGVMPVKVQAETATQNQSLEQKFEVQCQAEGYNQSCKVLGIQTANQSQTISLRGNLPPHQVVDTGLDLPMMAGSIATIMSGVVATVIKFKSRQA